MEMGLYMSKKEFLAILQETLAGQIPEDEIANQLDYYKSYINDSDSEKQVLEELGDPRLIARTIITSYEASKGPMAGYYTNQARTEYSNSNRAREQFDQAGQEDMQLTWYEKLLWSIVTIAMVIIVFSVLFFVLRVTLRIAVPFLIIMVIFVLIRNLFDH